MVLLVLLLSLAFVLPVSAASDVPEKHPFFEEIDYLVNKGIIRGYPDGTIRPDEVVTRAEATVMIGRLKGQNETQQATPFSDVPAGHYASGYIAESAEAKYIIGYEDGTFRPENSVIRGDMALIVERVFDLAFGFPSFTDVPENAYYAEAISKMAAANITIGYPDKTFRPRTEVTRGQFAAFLARALEPEFKNDAVIKNSYQKDKTKVYTYRLANGSNEMHRFVDVPERNGLIYGFMWTYENESENGEYLELENYEIMTNGFPYSERNNLLAYPVYTGKTFNDYVSGDVYINTITGVDVTVETAYKTFTNAVEVTTQGGYKYYMVEGYSVVKSLDQHGNVMTQLMNVE